MGFGSVVSGKGKVRVGAHFDERVEERRLHELVRCEEAVRARQGDGGLELGEDLVERGGDSYASEVSQVRAFATG